MRCGCMNDLHWLMLGALQYNDIIVRTRLIQRGETANGIVRTDCCCVTFKWNVLLDLSREAATKMLGSLMA